MPDLGGRDLHLLFDSVTGANWRPTRFEDELTLSRYACCACLVVPSTTVVLPCSHALCEQCLTGCAVQDGGSVCPIEKEPFSENECQRWQLPAKKKRNLKVHCWNEADGCEFVGTIEEVLQHYDRQCAFHALLCRRCGQKILRRHIAAHYVAGCSQNASFASGAQANRQDGSSAECYESAKSDQVSSLQKPMNEISIAAGCAGLVDISHAISVVGMKSIEQNIGLMVTRQLSAGLEELKALIRDPSSHHLSALQRRMNELVEQLRAHNASQLQEMVRELRNSEITLKQDAEAQLQQVVRTLRDSESKVKEYVKVQLREMVPVQEVSATELKSSLNTTLQIILQVLRDSETTMKQEVKDQSQQMVRMLRDTESRLKEYVKVQFQERVPVRGASECELRTNVNNSLQEILQMLRDSETTMKQDVKGQVQQMVRMLRDSESRFKEHLKVQLQEMLPVLKVPEMELKDSVNPQLKELVRLARDSKCELKEHVERVEGNLTFILMNTQQSLLRAIDSLQQNFKSREREGLPSAVASLQENIPRHIEDRLILRKLEACALASLGTLEFLRQEVYRREKKPWVSKITSLVGISCDKGRNEFQPPGFQVTLGNAAHIFRQDTGVFAVADQWYYRDMRIQISFFLFSSVRTLFGMHVDCVMTTGTSSFPFTKLTVKAVRNNPRGFLPFNSYGQVKCSDCFGKSISHFSTSFEVEQVKLAQHGVIEDGELTLRFEFL
ncbi:hypothetical protein MTO96_006643 [Rhipicephalus appendiculatus]